jgi:hypothetical protein
MSEPAKSTVPDPQPRYDSVSEPEWGATPGPIQEPAPEPRGARQGTLMIVGAVVLVAVVLLIIAVVRS